MVTGELLAGVAASTASVCTPWPASRRVARGRAAGSPRRRECRGSRSARPPRGWRAAGRVTGDPGGPVVRGGCHRQVLDHEPCGEPRIAAGGEARDRELQRGRGGVPLAGGETWRSTSTIAARTSRPSRCVPADAARPRRVWPSGRCRARWRRARRGAAGAADRPAGGRPADRVACDGAVGTWCLACVVATV